MRISLVIILFLLALSACSMGKTPGKNVSAEIIIPAGTTIQSGALYPSMPLEDFQKMQSGTTESGAPVMPIPSAL